MCIFPPRLRSAKQWLLPSTGRGQWAKGESWSFPLVLERSNKDQTFRNSSWLLKLQGPQQLSLTLRLKILISPQGLIWAGRKMRLSLCIEYSYQGEQGRVALVLTCPWLSYKLFKQYLYSFLLGSVRIASSLECCKWDIHHYIIA